jgi:hypothetical protein
MAFKERFYAALEDLLEANGIEGATVVDFDEVTKNDGYCETCWYEYTEVDITYTVGGIEKVYTYRGTFSELINDLT